MKVLTLPRVTEKGDVWHYRSYLITTGYENRQKRRPNDWFLLLQAACFAFTGHRESGFNITRVQLLWIFPPKWAGIKTIQIHTNPATATYLKALFRNPSTTEFTIINDSTITWAAHVHIYMWYFSKVRPGWHPPPPPPSRKITHSNVQKQHNVLLAGN
jgi:hypothetical protein